MRRLFKAFVRLAMLAASVWPCVVLGQEGNLNTNARYTLLEDVALVGAGVGLRWIAHEGAHEVMGLAVGNPVTWHPEDATWTTRSKHRIAPIAMAGFGGEIGLSALMLMLPADHPLAQGERWASTLTVAQYVGHSMFTPGGYGDFANLSHSDRNIAYSVLIGYVVLQAWDLLKEGSTPKFIRSFGNNVGLAVSW